MVKQKNEVQLAENEKTSLSIIDKDVENLLTDLNENERDLSSDYVLIPQLMLVQKLSDVTKKTNSKFIEGATEGKFVESISNKVFEEVHFVPCLFEELVIEWKPKESGGGRVAQHTKDSEIYKSILKQGYTNNYGIPTDPTTGNSFIETVQLYGLIVNDGAIDPVVIYFKGSFIRTVKQLNMLTMKARINNKPCRYYSYVYNLRSKITSNDKGEWAVWDVSYNNPVNLYSPDNYQEIVKAAMEYRKLLTDNKDFVRVDEELEQNNNSEEQQTVI